MVGRAAHGAGRKWTRSAARQRMRERFGMHQLTQTPLGGRVISGERDLLYEEAPGALQEHRGRCSGSGRCRSYFRHRDIPTAPHLQDAWAAALTRPSPPWRIRDHRVKACPRAATLSVSPFMV